MGNRAVITTKDGFAHNGLGIYLHWNGGRDSVRAFLKYCELKGFRSPDTDNYGWARLAQVIGNFFGGGLSIGIDKVRNLDCDNFDNGTYLIEGWEIVGRRYHDGPEQDGYDLTDMLIAIDDAQPGKEQLGEGFFRAVELKREDLAVGMTVYVEEPWSEGFKKAVIIGFGGNRPVNGRDVKGIPYVGLYGRSSGEEADNINNYLTNTTYRVVAF